MTLKENFKKWLDTNPRTEIREVQLEIIVDDFTIGFAEWVANSYYSYNFGIKMFQHRNKEIYKSTKELLEIYKKQKGL